MVAAIVVADTNHSELRDFRDLDRKIRVFKNRRTPKVVKDPTIPVVPYLDTIHLSLHRLHGPDMPPMVFAYWPENWLDEWGMREVCKFLKIDFKEEDYGASGYFVVHPDDVGFHSLHGNALQRSETSSSSHIPTDQSSDGSRSVDHAGDGTPA